jgi:ABC-type multidrug transport system fused ATPase/permease subunit
MPDGEEMKAVAVSVRPEEAPLPKKAEARVSELFSFADVRDGILIIFGVIGAAVNGAAMPVFSLFFGDILDSVGEQGAHVSPCHTPEACRPVAAAPCRARLGSFRYRPCESGYLQAGGPCSRLVVCGRLAAILFFGCGRTAIGPNANRVLQEHRLTGRRLVRNIRVGMCRLLALCEGSCGRYDQTTPSTIPPRVLEDISKIQAALGDKLGVCLMNAFMFIIGYTLGFIRGWKLALVICATLPLLAFLGGMMGKIIEETTKDNQTW